MRPRKILAMVMAGGEGKRLYPLTLLHSKPAVTFGGRYRIVDFVLSNMINSEIHSIYLLVQYRSQSLIEHIRKSWVMPPITPQFFVTVVPPQMLCGPEWFQGTADAVYQNLNLVRDHRPDLVAVFGADHIYRMDIRQMVEFHLSNNADATIAALPVTLDKCRSFGIVVADANYRVKDFQEKPEHPKTLAADPSRCYASMGNYLFNTDVLLRALEQVPHGERQDFGHDVLPRLLRTQRVYAYDFTTNRIPGIKPYEDPVYWRDVGTLDEYFDAHRDLLGPEPKFDVHNPEWPIYSSNYMGPVAAIHGGDIKNSLLGGGSIIRNAKVHNCVLRREVVIEEEAELEDCIIMDYSVIGRGARLRRTIVDRHNVINRWSRIGFDPDRDRQRYHVADSGIVVIPQGDRPSEFVDMF